MGKAARAQIPFDQLEVLDIEQAATWAGMGYEAMKGLIDAGEIPAWSANQKHMVVHVDDLRAYAREQAQQQAAARREARKEAREAAEERERPPRPAGRIRRVPPAIREGAKVGRGARPQALPDLSAYELTTASPPASNRAGSRIS